MEQVVLASVCLASLLDSDQNITPLPYFAGSVCEPQSNRWGL